MDKKTGILIFVILFAIILAGCQKQVPPGQVQVQTPEQPKAETFIPLKLEYSLKNFGPGGENTITYYLESKRKCNNRDAYLGLAKLESTEPNFKPQFAKVAIFTDNGEMAISRWNNEESMAFDDLTSWYNDMNILLPVNDIFIAAGKNFNSPENWQSEIPIVLKDVTTGRSKGNYSIIRQEEDKTGITPCTKFKIIAKTTNMDGYFNACLAKQINGINLPFVVSFNFQNEQGPSWQLKSFSAEKSGIAWVPQCLEAVKCVYVPELLPGERTACAAQKGRIDSDFDEKGCVIKYKCTTPLDQARSSISRVQSSNCEINQTVLNKYLGCLKNNKPNFDPTKYDNNGCLLDINCRP